MSIVQECECGNHNMTEESGYCVCRNCGTCGTRVLSHSTARVFTREEVLKKQTTQVVCIPYGPRTRVGTKIDANGKVLNSYQRALMGRIGKLQNSLNSSIERNLWKAIPIFGVFKSRLDIPEFVVDTALIIYNYIIENKLMSGRSMDAYITASLYTAVRIHGIPRYMDEFAKVIGITTKKVNLAFKSIYFDVLPNLNLELKKPSIDKYIDKFSKCLNLPQSCINYAVEAYKKALEGNLKEAGKNPKGIAGACIYLSTEKFRKSIDKSYKRTQDEIAVVAGTTNVTIRMRVANIYSALSKVNMN